MIKISENDYFFVLDNLKKELKQHSAEPLFEFTKHPYIAYREDYKFDVWKDARDKLMSNTWKEYEVGEGRIFTCVKDSIQTDVFSQGRTIQNNLIDWRKKDDFSNLKPDPKTEKVLFDFYKSRITDKKAYDTFLDLGFKYQLIAYLFFIKDKNKYVPISQNRFDSIFRSINIDFSTSGRASWENYQTYCDIIMQFKNYLKSDYKNIELLHAHTLLWMYGYQFREDKEAEGVESPRTEKKDNMNHEGSSGVSRELETAKPELPIYKPQADLSQDDIEETFIEIDFLERHRKQMEIGAKAEEIVLKSEIEYLEKVNPVKAKEVRLVSGNAKLGCDIISFEADGTQKQIEVKAISVSGSTKSFFISPNELEKSKTYPNYYIYCVSELDSEEPQILRLKHPDLEGDDRFNVAPQSFKISFN